MVCWQNISKQSVENQALQTLSFMKVSIKFNNFLSMAVTGHQKIFGLV